MRPGGANAEMEHQTPRRAGRRQSARRSELSQVGEERGAFLRSGDSIEVHAVRRGNRGHDARRGIGLHALEELDVVVHDLFQRCRAVVVEVWGGLPDPAQAGNGLRCARYAAPLSTDLSASIETASRDYSTKQRVSDDEHQTCVRFYFYGQTELKPAVEGVEEATHRRRERVSFEAAYGKERVSLISSSLATPSRPTRRWSITRAERGACSDRATTSAWRSSTSSS